MKDITEIDISSTYKGFRLQAILIMYKVLLQSSELQYWPEKLEDLAIQDKSGKITQLVQIKSSSRVIYLSTLEPNKKNGFFRRIEETCKGNKNLNIEVGCFAKISSELDEAFNNGNTEKQNEIRKKLRNEDYSDRTINEFFCSIKFREYDEYLVVEEIKKTISDTIGGANPEITIDILTKWIYDLSEKRESFTKSILFKKIIDIGEFFKDMKANYSSWFTFIKPFSEFNIKNVDKNSSEEAFWEGVSSSFEYILFDLDVKRDRLLELIQKKFVEKNIVIIHGASGQGKTTLAFRYIKEYYPLDFAFYISTVPDFESSIEISRSLLSYSDKLEIPILIHYDVNTFDLHWVNILKLLANRKYVKVLITIREENWRSTSIEDFIFPYNEIELNFGKEEAQEIYKKIVKKYTLSNVLSFEDSWSNFGEKGPLLEYVYFLRKTETLKRRLQKQLYLLEERRTNKALRFLGIIALITKYGLRVDLKRGLLTSKLETPESLLHELEKEYLIKILEQPNQKLIESMHPIRSSIIYEILFEEGNFYWFDFFKISIEACNHRDLQHYLLNIVYDKFDELREISMFLIGYNFRNWNELYSMYKALQWADIKNYYLKNKTLIEEVRREFREAWFLILDTNIAILKTDISFSFVNNLADLLNNDIKTKYKNYLIRQTSKLEVFTLSKSLLEKIHDFNLDIEGKNEWEKIAEIIFLTFHFNFSTKINSFIENTDYDSFLELPVKILAKVILAFFESKNRFFLDWYRLNKKNLINKYKEEFDVDKVSEEGAEIKIEYFWRRFLEEMHDRDVISNDHDENVKKIEVLRELIPDKEVYASDAYGVIKISVHQPDNHHKKIPILNLHPKYLPKINSIFLGVCNFEFRPNEWYDYYLQIKSKRQNVIENIEKLIKQIKIYFSLEKIKSTKFTEKGLEYFGELELALLPDIDLPKIAVDKFGIHNENNLASQYSTENYESKKENVDLLSEKSQFSKLVKDYFTYLNYFIKKAINIFTHHSMKEKGCTDIFSNMDALDKLMTEDPEHLIHLSLMNLKDAYRYLLDCQNSFKLLFEQYLEVDKEYEILNKRELKCFQVLLPIWFYFSKCPAKKVFNPSWLKENFIENFLMNQANLLKKNILRSTKYAFEIKEIADIKIDGELSLFVHLHLKNSDELDRYWKLIEPVLFDIFKDFSYSSLDFYIMEIFRKQIAFLFTYESLDSSNVAFRITLEDLVKKQSFIENIFLRIIPLEQLDNSSLLNKIRYYKTTLKKLADNLIRNLTYLRFLIEHIEKILEFPFENEDINSYSYLNRVMKRFGESIKELIELLDQFQEECSEQANTPPSTFDDLRAFFSSRIDADNEKAYSINSDEFHILSDLSVNLINELYSFN